MYVNLYTLDSDGVVFTDDMPHITFHFEDWEIFRNKICRDLDYPALSEYYSAIFDSLSHPRSYYIFTKQLGKEPSDYIYLCSPKCRIAERLEVIDPECVVQNLKLVYSWGDMPVLEDVFKKIDRLFMWSEHRLSYKTIQQKLFDSWPSEMECGHEPVYHSPIVYKHKPQYTKTRVEVLRSELPDHCEVYKTMCGKRGYEPLSEGTKGHFEVDEMLSDYANHDGKDNITVADNAMGVSATPLVMLEGVHINDPPMYGSLVEHSTDDEDTLFMVTPTQGMDHPF